MGRGGCDGGNQRLVHCDQQRNVRRRRRRVFRRACKPCCSLQPRFLALSIWRHARALWRLCATWPRDNGQRLECHLRWCGLRLRGDCQRVGRCVCRILWRVGRRRVCVSLQCRRHKLGELALDPR
eukprot:Amastigsp_a853192_2.p3 type:complete len:125 gc:universal Amastigsp_a853192_2:245-619(+)